MKTLNYSFRYLANRRGNTLARFVSLSLGLFVALIIFAMVGYYYSHNRWIPNHKQVYCVGQYSGVEQSPEPDVDYRTFYPIYEAMANDNPQIESVVPTYGYFNRKVSYNGKDDVGSDVLETTSSFFSVFGVKVISGDPEHALSSPNTAMISDILAETLFGNENPLGKSIKVVYNEKTVEELTVQGVFKNIADKATRLDYINGRVGVITRFDIDKYMHPSLKWLEPFTFYIKLRKNAKIEDIERNMEGIFDRVGAPEKTKKFEPKLHFTRIAELFVETKDTILMALLSLLAFISLSIACLNYVLLSISSLAERSRTIAMLRCHGAQKRDVFLLFLVETLLILLTAILWTAFVIWCLENDILTYLWWSLKQMFSLRQMWIPAVVCCAAFLLAGIIPAWLFSQVRLETAFRGSSDNYRFWKRTLLFIQMSCTIAVFIFMLICMRQLNYSINFDYGFRTENIYRAGISRPIDEFMHYIPNTKVVSYDVVASELKRLPFIEDVALGTSPVELFLTQSYILADDEKHTPLFRYAYVRWSHNMPKMIDIELVDGRYLTEDDATDKCLVTELFVERMGWKDSAIGKQIDTSHYLLQIVGVVKNFNGASVQGMDAPTVIMLENSKISEKQNWYSIAIRLSDSATSADKEQVSDLLKTISGYDRAKLTPYKEDIETYLSGQVSMRNIITVICVITLIIALSGLIGYMDNEMQRRRKEIAIRKVAGATVGEVMVMIAADLLWITIPATAFGVVIAYMAGSAWMQTIAGLRSPLSWWIFAAGAALVLAVVYAIQVARTWHTATANPIEMIKTE